MTRQLRVYLGPEGNSHVEQAILGAGGQLVPLGDAEVAVWTSMDPQTWFDRGGDVHLRWVQLLSAGVESWFAAGAIDHDRTWTSAAGAYAYTVAEHAIGLLLGVRRRFPECARADSWQRLDGSTVRGSTTVIVGCGSIGRALIPMLASVGSDVIAVTRSGREVEGASESYDPSALEDLWPRADAVVLAAPATDRTKHVVDARVLGLLPDDAVLINVARGGLVATDALVDALEEGRLGGAGLDVTDPEPLPDGHRLWNMPNVLLTPHVANPPRTLHLRLADRVEENVRRYIADEPLLGIVDLDGGY